MPILLIISKNEHEKIKCSYLILLGPVTLSRVGAMVGSFRVSFRVLGCKDMLQHTREIVALKFYSVTWPAFGVRSY